MNWILFFKFFNWIGSLISYLFIIFVNYNYIRDNQTNYRFTELEKKLKEYIYILDDNIKIKLYINEFIEHIRYSMKLFITDISIPFNIMSPKIISIKEKYKNNDYVMKYKKKSSKINYEVYNQLFN